MIILFWVVVFLISLALLVKSADWLLEKAEKIGLALGVSSFIIGVTIVGVGTSLPELISSLIATISGATEIVVANVFGSNVANILLIIGISAVVGRKLVVTKDLIDIDLPLLVIVTMIALGVVADRQVTFIEGLLLLFTCVIYLIYTIKGNEYSGDKNNNKDVAKVVENKTGVKSLEQKPKITAIDILFLVFGIAGLFLGSKYLIDAVIALSELLKISAGVIAISAVAVGTSLPELLVSVKAAKQGKSEIAIGNIFGSNVFNLLFVIGLPALFKTLQVDEKTFVIGIPALIIATLIFAFSGISRKIHIWEGLMYLVLYVLFIGKLFGFI